MTVRKRIREQAAKLPATANPGVVANAVLRDLADDELRDALRTALPYLVRDELRKSRHHSLGVADPRGRYAWKEPDPEPAPASLATVRARRAAGKAGFDAAQAKREREAALLATRISLGPGKWKELGDCTPTDLRALASHNHKRATENTARAAAYERLAADMQARGISRVRDYPDVAVIRDAIASAA